MDIIIQYIDLIKMSPQDVQRSDPYKVWSNQYANISYPIFLSTKNLKRFDQ